MVRLAEWEIALLPLSLITTKEEGRIIKARNRGLLKMLNVGDDSYAYLGCPHCMEVASEGIAHNCGDCRWNVIRNDMGEGDMGCTFFGFNGITFGTIGCCVDYCTDSEKVYSRAITHAQKAITTRFLKAHILWGTRIMNGTYKKYAKKYGIKKPRKTKGIWHA